MSQDTYNHDTFSKILQPSQSLAIVNRYQTEQVKDLLTRQLRKIR